MLPPSWYGASEGHALSATRGSAGSGGGNARPETSDVEVHGGPAPLANSILVVGYCDRDERVRFLGGNVEAWLGAGAEAWLGRPLREVVGDEAYEAVASSVRAALAGRRVQIRREIAFAASGLHHVEAVLEPDFAEDGSVRGLYTAVLDLAPLQRAAREVQGAEARAALAEHRERARLAADLHDDVAQLLSLASLKLDAMQHRGAADPEALKELAALVGDARRRIVSLSFQLFPHALHERGLVEAVRGLGAEIERSFGLEVRIESDQRFYELDEPSRVTAYRTIRELLLNVARHAGAPDATVRISPAGEMLDVEIADRGCGFDAGSLDAGFGLGSLRDRIELLGGRFVLDTAPGRGTRVGFSLPQRCG